MDEEMAKEYFESLQQRQLIVEFGVIAYIFVMAGILFFIYIKATPDEVIQDEYFFKVREPNIRKKRKLKEEAKKAKKMNVEI